MAMALAAPKIKDKDLAASYGWALSVLNSDKELKGLFKSAVKGQYTPARFVAELRGTKWFQTKSEATRKYIVLKTTEPAQYAAQVKQTMASMADQYSRLTGQVLEVNPPILNTAKKKDKNGVFVTVKPGTGSLFTMADTALKMGLNEAQINDQIVKSIKWKDLVQKDVLRGTASGQLQSWRQAAAALGVKPTDEWYASRLQAVSAGDQANEGVIGQLKKQASQRYGAFADDIENGATMQDLTENYRQSIGNVLEISPNQVDVFDKHIQAAVSAKDANGNFAPLNINDFEKNLRKDDRWQYTKNANDSLMGAGHNIIRSFGLAAA